MMKNPFILLILILCHFPVFGQPTIPDLGIKNKNAIYTLFKNATVHTKPGVTDTLSILIYKNEIVQAATFSEIEIPANTDIQDWEGYHIYPSFIEFNSNYGLPS